MQNTPFRDIQHHQDGRHIFTVKAGEEVKRFGTTDTIDAAKALRNALSWRNGNLGGPISPTEEATINRFVRELEAPTDSDKPIKLVKKPEAKKPTHVKVQQLPYGVRRTSEGTIAKAVKAGRPKVSDEERRIASKKQMVAPNRHRPGLPNGVSLFKLANGTVVLGANYQDGDVRRMRQFHVGKPENFTLAKYRMVRHIAICYRREYLESVAENRPMNLEAFKNPRKLIKEGKFPWPFKGTIVKAKSEPTGRTRDDFRKERLLYNNRKVPSLPSGVRCYSMKNNDAAPQIVFQVVFSKNRKRVSKSFYVSTRGDLDLKRYRIARHAAIAFREEYVNAVLEGREVRHELFKGWREKILNGTFVKPFKGSLPERRKPTHLKPDVRLGSRAGRMTKNVFDYLMSRPEFAPVFASLSDVDAEIIHLSVTDILNEELYYNHRKQS